MNHHYNNAVTLIKMYFISKIRTLQVLTEKMIKIPKHQDCISHPNIMNINKKKFQMEMKLMLNHRSFII